MQIVKEDKITVKTPGAVIIILYSGLAIGADDTHHRTGKELFPDPENGVITPGSEIGPKSVYEIIGLDAHKA